MAQNKKVQNSEHNNDQNNKFSQTHENQKKETKIDSLLGDTFKKILGSTSAVDIPKEIVSQVVNQVVGQVNKAKDEVTHRATTEILSLIQKIDFVKEFSKFAENHKFKISAEIEIIKKTEKTTDKATDKTTVIVSEKQ